MHPLTLRYKEISLPRLKSVREYVSPYLIPQVTKVSVNIGIGDIVGNTKAIEEVSKFLIGITAQKPVEIKARKAISGFKIREGMVVALKVTLRGDRMRDFLIKFIELSLPRTRDFRGLKPSCITADGNLNIGIKDSMIFPEADQDGAGHGVQVTVVSTARTLEEARALYESLGFYFGNSEDLPEVKKKKSRQYTKRK